MGRGGQVRRTRRQWTLLKASPEARVARAILERVSKSPPPFQPPPAAAEAAAAAITPAARRARRLPYRPWRPASVRPARRRHI